MRTNEPNWTKIWTDVAGNPGDERHRRRDGRRQFRAAPRLRPGSVVNDPGPAPHRRKSHLTGGSLAALGSGDGLANGRIEPSTLDFLRTLCGLGGATPRLTCRTHTVTPWSGTETGCPRRAVVVRSRSTAGVGLLVLAGADPPCLGSMYPILPQNR